MKIFGFQFCLLVLIVLCSIQSTANSQTSSQTEGDYSLSMGCTFSMNQYYSKTSYRNIKFFPAYSNLAYLDPIEGSDRGYSTGLILNIPLTQQKNISFLTRMQYQNTELNFREWVNSFPSMKPGGLIFNTDIYLSSEIDLKTFSIDLLIQYELPGTKLGITIGPKINYVSGSNHSLKYSLQSEEIVQFAAETEPGSLLLKQAFDSTYFPKNYHPRYVDESKTSIKFYEGDLEHLNSTNLSLLMGLQYVLDYDSFFIVPYFQYNLGFTPIVNVDTWSLNVIQAGLDIRVDI